MMNRILRGGGWTLIFLGLFVLEFAAYELIGTGLIEKAHQKDLRRQFQAEIDNPVLGGGLPSITNARAIADLKIPKISVDVIVVEGVKLADLVFGPGHYPSTPKFGEKGSTAIAGHRTGWGSPFLNIDQLRHGDVVTIQAVGGKTYTYKVTRMVIVDPSQASVLQGDPDSHASSKLTLTTCTPKYTSAQRLIVWADQVNTGGLD
ncbi:MAG: sortase [Actinomycetota bacterium]